MPPTGGLPAGQPWPVPRLRLLSVSGLHLYFSCSLHSRSPEGLHPPALPAPTRSLGAETPAQRCLSSLSCGPLAMSNPGITVWGHLPASVQVWATWCPGPSYPTAGLPSCLSSSPPHALLHRFHLPPSLPPSSPSGSHHPPAKMHPRRKQSSPRGPPPSPGGRGRARRRWRSSESPTRQGRLLRPQGPRRGGARGKAPRPRPFHHLARPARMTVTKFGCCEPVPKPRLSEGGRDQKTLCDLSKPSRSGWKRVHRRAPGRQKGARGLSAARVPRGPRGREGSLRAPCARAPGAREQSPGLCAQPARNPARRSPPEPALPRPPSVPPAGTGASERQPRAPAPLGGSPAA